jgi:NADPH:quinone reductase-like Zn-dependent oxidoreductase
LKAARFSQFGGPEVLEIVDLPDPHPGPGQVRIAVRAAGVNPSDWKKREGLMDAELPQTLGYEAATRALDQLGVGSGSTVLINGASGSVGSAAVQLAVARGARVIGTASPANHDYLRSLGAEPVAYGEGLAGRVRALAPDGVDLALDVAGSGVLPELIELAGGAGHVVTIADFAGAQEHGVRFSRGDTGRAVHVLAEIGELIESGRFSLPVGQTFPLAEIAAAHRVSEDGHVRGKLVLVVGAPS